MTVVGRKIKRPVKSIFGTSNKTENNPEEETKIMEFIRQPAQQICFEMSKTNRLHGDIEKMFGGTEEDAAKFLKECYLEIEKYPKKWISTFGLEICKEIKIFNKIEVA